MRVNGTNDHDNFNMEHVNLRKGFSDAKQEGNSLAWHTTHRPGFLYLAPFGVLPSKSVLHSLFQTSGLLYHLSSVSGLSDDLLRET